MINNNKILTVSYGTFSCTLEGFDDSFDTMKAIAEYFRDLASDDRYFGAEPPQPDADMLAKIAEREVSRRVEVHEHKGRIMLKAHEEAATAIPAPVFDTAEPEVAEKAHEHHKKKKSKKKKKKSKKAKANKTNTLIAAAVIPAVAEEQIVENEVVEDEVIGAEAAWEETAQEDVLETPEIEDDPFLERVTAEPESTDTAPTVEVEMAAEDLEESAASFFAQGVEDASPAMEEEETISAEVFIDSTLQDATDDDVEDLVADEVDPAQPDVQTESFADKLERIRAVVSTQEETEEATPDYDEDTEVPAAVEDFDELNAAFADTEEPEAQNEVIAEAAQDITNAFEQDDDTQEQADLAETDADDLDDILKRIEESSDDEDFDLSAASEEVEDEGEDEDTAENLFEAPEPAEAEEEQDEEVRGRVLKVNRSDLEAALASGDLEEYEDDEPSSDLSQSAQEETAPEHDFAAALEETAEPAESASETARQGLPSIDEETGEDISRLMAEADHQMEEPEGKTRRSAFAHLRAAVAARFADGSMNGNEADEDAEAEAYRSDLAEAVKPRRPEAPAHRSERPTDDRAAPLKLVAEQRIDAEVQAERGPVSPRRVAASFEEDLVLTDDSGFAAYAEERSAETLPQLLEAAAAYLSYVEGHEQFSRPQLMSRVRQADCGEFSREDGLRSFGQLLRNGKIEKIKGGRFTASESIGYKPDHRAAC